MGQAYFNRQLRLKQFTIVFLSLVLVYFVFHLFVSERSISALMTLSKTQAELSITVVSLADEKLNLQDHVMRLRPDTLDVDLVEDYTIRMLGHATSGGLIIMNDQRS
jgi:cell division protein FtsB